MKLYLVTDRDLSLGRSLEEVVSEAVKGGVTIVQLREKETSTGEFVALARRLMKLLKPLNIPLIINDRVDVALAVDADGRVVKGAAGRKAGDKVSVGMKTNGTFHFRTVK